MSPWRTRPVTPADLVTLGPWLAPGADTTLPAPGGPDAWWLAEDARGIGAALRLRGPIGLQRPRHWYHVGCVVHAVPELQLFRRQATLLLCNDHTGASELADAVHHPARDAAEQAGAWQVLLHAARTHLAATRAQQGGALIAELPGLRDVQGRSPFWHGLGRHFHAGDPDEVLRRHGPEGRAHLAALLPRQPVYCTFLSEAAQAALAQAAPAARVWMQALADTGLRYSHHVDILDGGPVLEAHLDSFCATR
jgi:arginine N-succinyltransferase